MTSHSGFQSKGLLTYFSLLFLPFAGIFTAVSWPVLQSYEEGRISIIKARESGYLHVSSHLITSEFHRSLSELHAIIRNPLLQRYLNEGMQRHRNELEQLFLIHANGYRRYDQIRLLDVHGHEVMRINYSDGNSTSVPATELQDKSQRYYFVEANKLVKGEVYVSPIDLNMEHGEIETPYKPTIRFATPLFDNSGRRLGVLVLNYHGNILLQAFKDDIHQDKLHKAMLLNPDSYWISSPEQGQEWGFMLGRNEARFSIEFPTAWAYIQQTREGEFETDRGLLLFSTIYPLQSHLTETGAAEFIENIDNKDMLNYYWKVVIFIPRDSLYATSFIRDGYGKILIIAIYLLLALLALLSSLLFLHSKQRREQEAISTREIEDLYNHAPCGYHSLDPNGLIVKINQTELDWLGYDADEMIGKMKYSDLLTAESLEYFRNKFKQFLFEGEVHDVELEVTRKDGSILPVMVSATAVRDSKNNVVMSRSTVFDMTERKKLEQRLKQQATTDFLTGLNNRRNFYYLAEVELVRTQRNGKPVSVLLIDIDHFKKINDTYGHEIGDKALQIFSSICRKELREIDILGRVGGEEFAALLPETDEKKAIEVARRLCKAISSLSISVSPDLDTNMTVSIGIAKHAKSDRSIHNILKRADKALYTAKKGGRNQICYEDPDTNSDNCTAS